MIQRYLPAILVLGIGCNELFHAIFDIFSYEFKVKLVGWVISMDKTPDPDAMRGIDSAIGAYIAYGGIWLAHAIGGVIAIFGAYLLATSTPQDSATMQRAHSVSVTGIGIGVMLYLIGFVTIASGFFLMHSGPTPPNFLDNAQRLFLCYMAVLIYLEMTRQTR
jgi:predicted small integral membrane protein